MSKIKQNPPVSFDKILAEYIPDVIEDEEKVMRAKQAVMKLSPADRNLFLIYVDCGTFAAVSKVLHSSQFITKKKIAEIRQKILDNL